MASQILIGHNLSPADNNGYDGPAFICTESGTARAFPSIVAAANYIKRRRLNIHDGHYRPVWSVFVLTEIADGEILQYSSDPTRELEPVR